MQTEMYFVLLICIGVSGGNAFVADLLRVALSDVDFSVSRNRKCRCGGY